MRILITAAAALPLLLTSLTLTLAPTTPALALPTHSTCVVTTYYNNAQFDQEVGSRSKCTGSPMQSTGRVTPWHTSETFSTDTPGGGHTGGGGGNLPCEFLASGCSNLPTNRFSG